MDIRKLQRAIVDGLEDVKAQDIQVFNTEHLSPLFERVIMASGMSNRQTKALAASVRDAVRSQGFPVMRTEGEDNGEWIIVDCGAAVAHIMQPEIRRYYHLEEIWGGKSVKMKFGEVSKGLVKASAPDDTPADTKKRAAAKKPAAKYSSRPAASAPAAPAAPARKSAAGKTPAAKKPAARKAVASKSPVAKKAPARAASAARAPATKRAPAKKSAPSRKTSRA